MCAGIEGRNSALKRKGLSKLAVRGLVKGKWLVGLKQLLRILVDLSNSAKVVIRKMKKQTLR